MLMWVEGGDTEKCQWKLEESVEEGTLASCSSLLSRMEQYRYVNVNDL